MKNTIPTSEDILKEICGCLKIEYDHLSGDKLSFMLELINNWKELHIEDAVKRVPVFIGSVSDKEKERDKKEKELVFHRVLNTLRTNKVMVQTREDGIYVRMAGSEELGECFSLDWAMVKSFKS